MTFPVPTRRLVVLAAAVSIGLWLLPDLGRLDMLGVGFDVRFVGVNGVLLALAVVDGVLAPGPATVQVRRVHPRLMTLDVESAITLEVEPKVGQRRWGASSQVRVADQLAPSLRAATRRVTVALPQQGMVRATIPLVPTRRGRFEPAEIVVRTSGPLGLVNKQRRRNEPTMFKVIPPFRSARDAELILRRARTLEIGIRSARVGGGGTEFDSLRELTPDDETRRIDWAATARSQRPIVRTYRAERNQTVLCLLDSGRTMAGRVDGVPRLEHAMDGAMLLAELATGLGDRMGLLAFDTGINASIEPSNRRSQRATVTETLFDLEPALAESNYQQAATHVLARYRRRAFLVILTELGREAIEQFLMPALPLLIRTHIVVIAALRDPDVVHWTGATTNDEDGAFLRSASVAALNDREVVAARLRAMGTIVVDTEPARFSSTLGEVYLDAKAAGRL
ncbi:MAG: DUF58 domain-containing protein [Actinomycetia bacterium]|nr:DUF58 domain-containing protein [Actinomycetes bacterium]MCP5031854.1 DUF58 domain-containing protein [Actinomycetes bacterium]